MGPNGPASYLLSSEWRASPDFALYSRRSANLNLGEYQKFGNGGHCLAVHYPVPAASVQKKAGLECYLAKGTEPVEVTFTVSQSLRLKRWEIARIELR